MRIVDLQRRLREVGRIRIGQRVSFTDDKGEAKSRPEKLEQFRLTSRDEQVIRAAAEEYGGTCQPWEDAPDGTQWEVYTSTDQFPVVLPPGDMAFSQAYEQWARGGCKVRCDGQFDYIGDKACHCDPENRDCDPHSRLNVILPDLPGFGVWRLDTQSYYAAIELAGLVDVIAAQSARGVMLPARLRLEQRSVKRPGEGIKRFAVPVLDVDVHPLALAPGGSPTPNLTPVPEITDGAGAPSIAEQVARIDEPEPKAARSNAAAPIPSTGIEPRPALEAQTEPSGVTSEAVFDRIVAKLDDAGVSDPDETAKSLWRMTRPQAVDNLIPETELARVLAEVDQHIAGFPEAVDA